MYTACMGWLRDIRSTPSTFMLNSGPVPDYMTVGPYTFEVQIDSPTRGGVRWRWVCLAAWRAERACVRQTVTVWAVPRNRPTRTSMFVYYTRAFFFDVVAYIRYQAVADLGGGWGMHPPTGGPAYRDFFVRDVWVANVGFLWNHVHEKPGCGTLLLRVSAACSGGTIDSHCSAVTAVMLRQAAIVTIPPQILRHRQQNRQWSATDWTISDNH